MHRLVINVQTGEIKQVPLTKEEIAALPKEDTIQGEIK